MRPITQITAVVGVLLLTPPAPATAQDEKVPKPAADAAKPQGKWTVVSIEVDGKIDKSDEGKTVTIEGDKLTLPELGDKIAVKFNTDRKPHEFDLLDGEGKVALRGIYKLDGDTLVACYPNSLAPDAARPTEFSGAKDKKQVLLTLKREGKKKE
jgi:uncharacterized protein (TIGR03067 family)